MARVLTRQHQWVGATYIDLDETSARRGHNRGTVRVREGKKVEVLDVLCVMCRRSYDDVAAHPCSAYDSTEHLRGGPIGERAKRKHPEHDCAAYGCTLGAEEAAAERIRTAVAL